MISDPCGLEVLVTPIVIVPAAATSGTITMDATSGGTSCISESKFNKWRKTARPGSQNALKTFQQPPLISKCTFYRHRITLPKELPATPLGLAGRRTVSTSTRQPRCVSQTALTRHCTMPAAPALAQHHQRRSGCHRGSQGNTRWHQHPRRSAKCRARDYARYNRVPRYECAHEDE